MFRLITVLLKGLPNVLLAFVTGSIVDKIGYRPSLVGFSGMVATGISIP